MPVPLTTDQFLELIKKSNLLEAARLDPYLQKLNGATLSANDLARHMVEDGLLTMFQSEQLLQGKWRGYTIGKYKVLERLGAGGMGSVYLCEHLKMKHRVAVKVLPVAKACDPAALGRFYREARASGVLDHPSLVRAHDIDQDGELHYLVMDYVDGVNLQHLVARYTGPLPIERACHYVCQAAAGLQHAFEAGLIHRDIKPANLLVDRSGQVRVLDMGLARFFEDNQDLLTIKFDDNNVLGTADYVSPEQAMDSHAVDIRTDIYSLGATFYFLLTGQPLFPEGRTAQKLIWHGSRDPVPLRQKRADIPPELEDVVAKMLAKKPEQRYSTPAEVIEALQPWVQTPIDPPADSEIPQLSPAARAGGSGESGSNGRSSGRAAASGTTRRHAAPHAPGRAARPATVASLSLPATAPSADHATPRALSGETRPDYLRPAATPMPAPTGTSSRPRRRLGRIAFLCLILTLGATAGIVLRWKFRTYADSRHDQARVLTVDRSKAEGTFRSIADALKQARAGDTILVREPIWDEVLRLESGGALGQRVTVKGAGEDGKPVVWQAPAGVKDLPSLIHLSAVSGLRLENFTLDGKDVTHHLITIAGPCPGLTLADLQLQGFRASGVRLTSGVGEETSPVLLDRLHAAPTQPAEAGILLDAYPDQPCRHVRVRECRLEGHCQAGVVIACPVVDLEVLHCQLTGLGDGILYRKGPVPAPVQLTLTGNTFRAIQRAGLFFEAPPPVEGSQVRLVENRFHKTAAMARMEGFRPEPVKSPASWVWTDPTTAPTAGAKVAFRKEFTLESVPTRALLSVTGDQSCTVWVNGQRVGHAPFNETAKRVHGFEVSRFLKQGDNVLAVEVIGGKARGGLLAELQENSSGVFTRLLGSDATWKVSEQPASGWRSAPFDDKLWVPASVTAAYGAGDPAWRGLIWEVVVQEQFQYQGGKLFPLPAGNERDAESAEGFPSFDATVRLER